VKRQLMLSAALALMAMLVIFTPGAVWEGPIRLIIGGAERLPDAPPVIVNDRVMVPIRFISEALTSSGTRAQLTGRVESERRGGRPGLSVGSPFPLGVPQ